MQDALYLLDGYSLVYRSYFAFIRRPMFNPKGKNSSAIFGFFRSLLLLFGDRKPTHFAVALDSTTPTFRHEKYPPYKATRAKTPEDLRDEIPVIEEILKNNKTTLINIAKALLEREILDSNEIKILLDGKKLPKNNSAAQKQKKPKTKPSKTSKGEKRTAKPATAKA